MDLLGIMLKEKESSVLQDYYHDLKRIYLHKSEK